MDKPVAGRVETVPVVLAAMLLAAGIVIAWVDTRPTWDDTGITAGALLIAAALGGALGVRPWLVALLVVIPLLIAELSVGVSLLIPCAVALVAAYGGGLARQMIRSSSN